jgi:hypothetical protein
MSGKAPYNKAGNGTAGAKGSKPPDGNAGKASNNQNNQQSRYQRQMQGKQGQSSVRVQGQTEKAGRKENLDRSAMRLAGDAIDAKFGFNRMKDGPERFDQHVTLLLILILILIPIIILVLVLDLSLMHHIEQYYTP